MDLGKFEKCTQLYMLSAIQALSLASLQVSVIVKGAPIFEGKCKNKSTCYFQSASVLIKQDINGINGLLKGLSYAILGNFV